MLSKGNNVSKIPHQQPQKADHCFYKPLGMEACAQVLEWSLDLSDLTGGTDLADEEQATAGYIVLSKVACF